MDVYYLKNFFYIGTNVLLLLLFSVIAHVCPYT